MTSSEENVEEWEDQIKILAFNRRLMDKWKREWACQLTAKNPSGNCTTPEGKVTFLGIRVAHHYVPTENIVFNGNLFNVSHSNECWMVLEPLMCLSAYRPCIPPDHSTKHIELRQVIPGNVCQEARKQCLGVIEAGLWPPFVDCHHSEGLFDPNAPQPNGPPKPRPEPSDSLCRMLPDEQ
ncbi:hypothetical protein AAVH_25046 [Aphelenchoides avenae]|nr:hypothetical protein AAVH_25046 [Aphelenchus avenae]